MFAHEKKSDLNSSQPNLNFPRATAFILILAAALVFRLAAMHNRVLLGDEVGTANFMRYDYSYLMSHYGCWNTQPAYSLLSRFSTQLFGINEFAVRLPALLFGLAGLPIIYKLGSRIYDARAGFISMLLLAFNPYHIFYSQMAKGYSMASTLSMLSIFFFLKMLDDKKIESVILYVFSSVFAVYSHLGSAGILLAEAFLTPLVLFRARAKTELRRCLLLLAASAALICLTHFRQFENLSCLLSKSYRDRKSSRHYIFCFFYSTVTRLGIRTPAA